jgi:hypothetical protein
LKKMDERDRERQAIDARPEGTGRLRAGVGVAQAGADRVRDAGERVREVGEDAAWLLRERVVWPAQDGLDALGPRGQIGVFGGGGIAVAGVVAALLIASGGSGSSGGATTEAFVIPERVPQTTSVAPTPKPKKQKVAKPTGPTLHGAAPDFSAAQDIRAGVGDGKAVGKEAVSGDTGGVSAERGARHGAKASARGSNDAPASTAKIGSTPQATASAAQAEALSNDNTSGAARAEASSAASTGKEADAGEVEAATGPPAPKAAKRVARHFAEAFVVYEIDGVDAKVRSTFRHTTTKQLSTALLHRPPRQPAAVKVPRAKVVTVVAGPSKGSVYEVSVSLLRVGVTSELRLQMEKGPGKKWQVTNVLG